MKTVSWLLTRFGFVLPIVFSLFLLIPSYVTAQNGKSESTVSKKYAEGFDESREIWEKMKKADSKIAKLFCSSGKPVCVSDWEGFRSPLGGWRLINPDKCVFEPTPCPLGSNVRLNELDFTAIDPGPGPSQGWAPCDVFPDPNDNSTLKCDDTCGCSILRWNCAGDWSCNPDECSCSPE